MTTSETAIMLRQTVERAAPELRKMSDDEARVPLSPDKWSTKQVVGHLVDSASNNHQRFVRASLQDAMVFPGYDQDKWVEQQGYQESLWPELLELWVSFNRHLAHLIERLPAEVCDRPRAEHNLHEIAWESPRVTSP